MEVSGKVKVVQEVVEKGTFKSRNIVVTSDEQYPQDISVQFVQDKCDLLNNIEVGSNVTIGINLRGREWTNPQGEAVYFNTIQGWKIAINTTPEPQPKSAPVDESNDLPF